MVKTLREAIGKADRNLESMLAGIIPTRPDRQYILLYQAFYLRRRFSVMKSDKIMTGIKGNGKINLNKFKRKFISWKICNDIFIGIFGDFKSENP